MLTTDADALWLTSMGVYDAPWSRWQTAPERGRVQLWPEQAEQLTAGDIPHGVRVEIDALAGPRWLRRGAGAGPLVFEADLGAPRLGWWRSLDIDAYYSVVKDVVGFRSQTIGDVHRRSDTINDADPDGVDPVWVRVRLATAAPAPFAQATARVLGQLTERADQLEGRAARLVHLTRNAIAATGAPDTTSSPSRT